MVTTETLIWNCNECLNPCESVLSCRLICGTTSAYFLFVYSKNITHKWEALGVWQLLKLLSYLRHISKNWLHADKVQSEEESKTVAVLVINGVFHLAQESKFGVGSEFLQLWWEKAGRMCALLSLALLADTSWKNNISTKYNLFRTQKQTEWPINSVMHSFHSVLMAWQPYWIWKSGFSGFHRLSELKFWLQGLFLIIKSAKNFPKTPTSEVNWSAPDLCFPHLSHSLLAGRLVGLCVGDTRCRHLNGTLGRLFHHTALCQ